MMTREEMTSIVSSKISRHKNLTDGTVVPSVGDRTLDEEHKDFNKKGQKKRGFASSIIPTLEEKTIMEKRPPKDQTDCDVTLGDQTIIESESDSVQNGRTTLVNGGLHEPRTDDNVHFGTPATHHKSPHGDVNVNEHPTRILRSDANEEEHTSASARATIRNNLASKSSRKPWTVPTMKPKVGPQDFEDPISDTFWMDIWVASAVHNVSATSSLPSIISHKSCCTNHGLLQTEIYRKVFHAIPDDLITTWKQYREFVVYHERLSKPVHFSLGFCIVAD